MDFNQLQATNKQLRTTDIKGKTYVEVNERIKGFRVLFPNGFIRTEIIQMGDGVVTIQAKVGYHDIDGEYVLATGFAQEKESSSYINKTSYIENCETSAVGRALGMLGIGIDTSVASAEEVTNAIEGQKQLEDAIAEIKSLVAKEQWPALFNKYRVRGFDGLTLSQAEKILERARK